MAKNIFYPKEGTNPFIKSFDEYKDLYKQSIDNPSEFFEIWLKKIFNG